MLKDHSTRICSYFAVDFEPCLDARVAEAAEKIRAQFKPQEINARVPFSYLFRWPSQRYLATLDVRRFACQSLGLTPWNDNLTKHLDMIKVGLDTVRATEFARIGFKVSAYLPLSMSHAELSDLMFGSFLASAQDLDCIFGEHVDPLLQMHGEKDGFKYVLTVTPMNPEQIANNFRQHGNLEHFLEDRFLDTAVKRFQEDITSSDCLYFDIDLFQQKVSPDRLREFAKSSLAQAERMADMCVRFLRSQPIVQGE